jgi:hypothetical protein
MMMCAYCTVESCDATIGSRRLEQFFIKSMFAMMCKQSATACLQLPLLAYTLARAAEQLVILFAVLTQLFVICMLCYML